MIVALLSFNRPEYLQQVVDSIIKQSYKDYKIFLFQDGPLRKSLWRRKTWDYEIKTCIQIFEDSFPEGHLSVSKENIGIAKNWRRAEHKLFLEDNFDEVLFLEDDLVLSEHYFETILSMFNEFREIPEVGMFNAFGEVDSDTDPCLMKEMGHLWAFGTTKKAWLARQDFFDKYYALISNVDYSNRPIKKIYDLYQHYGGRTTAAHSQDGAKSISMLLANQIKISTSANLGKYIGKTGFHATPAFYEERGFDRMPICMKGPLSDFRIDQNKIKTLLQAKYMEYK